MDLVDIVNMWRSDVLPSWSFRTTEAGMLAHVGAELVSITDEEYLILSEVYDLLRCGELLTSKHMVEAVQEDPKFYTMLFDLQPRLAALRLLGLDEAAELIEQAIAKYNKQASTNPQNRL